MNALFIDTSNNKEITIKVEKDKQIFEKVFLLETVRAAAILPSIEEMMKESGSAIKDINHIYVKRGPGSFTGLRVGVSIANALSFALGIPVNDKKMSEVEEPEYS